MMVGTHLGYDGEPAPELVQPDLPDVDAVDEDAAGRRLDDAEQRERHRALPGARPTHDPDLQQVLMSTHSTQPNLTQPT